MLVYHIGIFDTQTKKVTTILCLPERRRDPKRITRTSINKWIQSIMGSQWWDENWPKVSTVTKRVN